MRTEKEGLETSSKITARKKKSFCVPFRKVCGAPASLASERLLLPRLRPWRLRARDPGALVFAWSRTGVRGWARR